VLDVVLTARGSGYLADARVVVAADDQGVTALCRSAGVPYVINPDADQGLSTSLRCGLAALPADADAALVLLGDQPMIRLDVIARLTAVWHAEADPIVRPRYAGAPDTPGHPVLLGRAVWPLAERLRGDAGLGALLASGEAGVTIVEVPGINPDIDLPADLHTLDGPPS
jgi:molybdenum cofactor cytidylyltransferase